MCFAMLISSTSQRDEFVGAEGNADVAILFPAMDITQTSLFTASLGISLYCCIFAINICHILGLCVIQNSIPFFKLVALH